MAFIAGMVDIIWYVLVAVCLAGTNFIDSLKANVIFIDRFTGMILLILALLLVIKFCTKVFFNIYIISFAV